MLGETWPKACAANRSKHLSLKYMDLDLMCNCAPLDLADVLKISPSLWAWLLQS